MPQNWPGCGQFWLLLWLILYDKMATGVFKLWTGPTYNTQVWISKQARKKLARAGGAFGTNLQRFAREGFGQWIGSNRPIRRERDGAFRIGDSSTFRLYGFFN